MSLRGYGGSWKVCSQTLLRDKARTRCPGPLKHSGNSLLSRCMRNSPKARRSLTSMTCGQLKFPSRPGSSSGSWSSIGYPPGLNSSPDTAHLQLGVPFVVDMKTPLTFSFNALLRDLLGVFCANYWGVVGHQLILLSFLRLSRVSRGNPVGCYGLCLLRKPGPFG